MKHTLIFALTAFMIAASLPVAAQQPLPNVLSGNTETTLRGRIVLYDWASHEATAKDDFVIKTMDAKDGNLRYARVIYKPFWGFDAPAAKAKDVLDRWAFVGRGASWSFVAHTPQASEERAACSAPITNHKYEDETGTGEIPRFISTPGAEAEKVPPVHVLPCFILNRGGLARSDHAESVDLGGGNLPVVTSKPKQ